MSKVIRINRADEQDAFILMHVVNSGSSLLNLTLTATEGECPYIGTIQERRLKELRAKNYQGSDDEWTQIITHILGQESSPARLPTCTGLETTATINGTEEDNKEIIITIRKRVESITQKLGSIILTQDDDQAIELFEWSGIAAAKADKLESQIIDLTDQHRVAEDTIHKLKKQLEDLMQAKADHETALVANFAQLLNEKKLKIRNQQRLLACATVNPEKVAEIQATSTGSGGTREEHVAKRSADDMNDTDDDSSDGFEKMEIDQKKPASVDDQETDQETDQNTDDDDEHEAISQASEKGDRTESDDDDDEPGNQGEMEESTTKSEENVSLRRAPSKEEAPPPRRELPFTRRKAPEREEPVASQNEVAEETAGETDDDEL